MQLQGLAAACCDDVNAPGLNFNGGLQLGDGVTDVTITRMPTSSPTRPAGGFLERVERAVQAAVHPDSVPVGGEFTNSASGGGGSASGEAVAFPVVSPYRPLTATRVPVAGLTAFPKSGYYFNGEPDVTFNNNGDPSDRPDEIPGQESLGFFNPMAEMPNGVSLTDDGYTPLGMKWEGVIGQIVQTTPGIISSVRGTPYYDPSQNVNPQLFPRVEGGGVTSYPLGGGAGQNAPEGYYYDERGTLRQIGSSVGGAVGGIGQSISDFVQRNPLLVLGGGAALVLLFMSPPRRR